MYVQRASCAWCREQEGECGYHFLRCSSVPRKVLALRDQALRLVYADAQKAESVPISRQHLGEENLQRLYCLHWQGKAAWRPGRSDKGRQPSQDALKASLVFMREAINAYAGVVDEVRPLPVYGEAPCPTDEEQDLAQQLWEEFMQEEEAEDERAIPSSQDSLQALGDVDSD
jgi:hypothetical protein